MRRSNLFPLALLVGLPALAIYTLTVQDSTGWGWGTSAFFTARVMLLAGGIGWLFHPLIRRLGATRRSRIALVAAHVALGLIFGALWVVATEVMQALINFENPIGHLRFAPNIPSRVLVGAMIYGSLAGSLHASTAEERALAATERAARAEAEAVRSRLTALRAQLDPHLLFNALNTVAGLIRTRPDEAEAAVEALSSLLRDVLEDGRDWVTLGEEWAFVSTFLELERMRFGDRIRIDVELADETLDLIVPAYVLQTLVENAVRHGLGPEVRGGCVTVRSRLETASPAGPARLVLSVADDGAGADPTNLAEGLGIGGLRSRLDTVWGSGAQLSLQTAVGGGFRVQVTMPALDDETSLEQVGGRSAQQESRQSVERAR